MKTHKSGLDEGGIARLVSPPRHDLCRVAIVEPPRTFPPAPSQNGIEAVVVVKSPYQIP